MSVRQSWKINKDLLVYKAFYFFYFGALGTINPYLPVYLRQLGLSAFAVGLLVGLRPIMQLASAPFWTVLADKFRKRKSILIMSIMAWLIMTIALVFVEPTEEICQLTAKNRSHSIYMNYTTLKTGFFKRSMERTWPGLEASASSSRNTIETTSITRRQVLGSGKILNVLEMNADSPSKMLMSSDLSRLTFSHGGNLEGRQLQGQLSASNINTFQQDPVEQNTHRKGKQKRSNAELQNGEENITELPFLKILKKKKPSLVHNSNDNNLTITEPSENQQEKPKGAFDPFNMNGKDSTVSARLTNFFDKTRPNFTTNTATQDAQYYNMNGVGDQQRNPTKSHSSELTLKLHEKNSSILLLRKPKPPKSSSSGRAKGHTEDGSISLDSIEKVNETLLVGQKNLFKSNTNEMKRLFVILLVLIVVGEFLETPSAPLSDASLLDYLGEGRIHYGKQRLWGSLGQGISSFLVGTLLEHSRHLTCGEEFIDYSICFCAFTLLMLPNLVITANFKFKYKDTEESSNSVLSTVLSVHYVSFLTAACYMGMCHGLIHNFLMWFLEDLGGSKTLMGLAMGSRCSGDLITFFVASLLIERLGQIKIVFIALISYGVIFIAYSSMTNPWFALAVEFLEGFTYAASWSACTSYLAEAAPDESVATMQGILQGVYWGLGTGTGAILGGHLIHTVGAYVTFRFAAVGSFVVALLFAATQWKWQRENLDESLGIYDYFSSGKPKDTEPLLKDNLIGDNTEDHRKGKAKEKERRAKVHKKQDTN